MSSGMGQFQRPGTRWHTWMTAACWVRCLEEGRQKIGTWTDDVDEGSRMTGDVRYRRIRPKYPEDNILFITGGVFKTYSYVRGVGKLQAPLFRIG